MRFYDKLRLSLTTEYSELLIMTRISESMPAIDYRPVADILEMYVAHVDWGSGTKAVLSVHPGVKDEQ